MLTKILIPITTLFFCLSAFTLESCLKLGVYSSNLLFLPFLSHLYMLRYNLMEHTSERALTMVLTP